MITKSEIQSLLIEGVSHDANKRVANHFSFPEWQAELLTCQISKGNISFASFLVHSIKELVKNNMLEAKFIDQHVDKSLFTACSVDDLASLRDDLQQFLENVELDNIIIDFQSGIILKNEWNEKEFAIETQTGYFFLFWQTSA